MTRMMLVGQFVDAVLGQLDVECQLRWPTFRGEGLMFGLP
jgi:hypothetical protein